MGCGDSRDSGVQRELDDDRMSLMRVHKLLLLGAGNSGKSTFMKQLSEVYGSGLREERSGKATAIQDSVIFQMGRIVDAYQTHTDDTGLLNLSEDARRYAEMMHDTDSGIMSPEIAKAIKTLWAEPLLKQVYEQRTTLSIVDSCKYFFDDIDRIGRDGYVPTEEDYVLARVQTTGMNHAEFTIKGNKFEVHDVGGQRSERSKWIHLFSSVDAVLFVASLSCYDQMLHEDEHINAMEESLQLFSETINNRYFRHTGFILFLNKKDLFEAKIIRRDIINPADPEHPPNQLKTWFPDYTGKMYDYDDGVSFILEKYKSMSDYTLEEKPIMQHVTVATAKDNVQLVFDDVQNQVVMRSLKKNGLL